MGNAHKQLDIKDPVLQQLATHIAKHTLEVCKHQASKNRSLDNIDLESVVFEALKTVKLKRVDDGRLSEVQYSHSGEFDRKDNEDWNDYYVRTQDLMNAMQEVSDNLPEGEIVGGIISFPVADGTAAYKVVQASPLVIEHIPNMDDYQAPAVTLRGINVEYIKEQLKRSRELKKIFRKAAP